MTQCPIPDNEEQRIASLQSMCVLDTPSNDLLDHIVNSARNIFSVPIVLISLVDHDRQWFISKSGVNFKETTRELSFCAHAICNNTGNNKHSRLFEVKNAANDNRFMDNFFVTNQPYIKYYLGYVIQSERKYNIGTLCLIDTKERNFTRDQVNCFCELASLVESLLQHHKLYSYNKDNLIFNSFCDMVVNYYSIQNKIALLDTELAKAHSNFNEWQILNLIINFSNVTPAFIGKEIGYSSPLVTVYLKKLESKKLIQKSPAEYDRRSRKLIATDKGYDLWMRGLQICKSLNFP